MRILPGLVAVLLLISPSAASDAIRQQAMDAASFYLALAGSCQTIVGSPDMFKAAVDDSLQTLMAGGYTAEEAAAATDKMADVIADTAPLAATLDFCTSEIQAIVDGREAMRTQLEQSR